MHRSPHFYPLNRGMDADAGGAADLQTDVMRFMAIISMCLVAIFALVQSIPLAPVPPVEPTPLQDPQPPAEPIPEPPVKSVSLVRPEPPRPAPAPDPVELTRPVSKPVAPPPPATRTPPPTSTAEIMEPPLQTQAEIAAETAPSSAPTEPAKKGFTLRFESDAALTWLVERDVVGLYAITSASIHRMNIDAGGMSFWPASAPQRFHEMDVATVPSAVLREWRKRGVGSDIKWGVSIPAPMARDLDGYLSRHEGGSLVIGRDGNLRMEP